jgi:hypothetical protein
MCVILAKATEPYWVGYGGASEGFTCCDLPGEELQPPVANIALVSLVGGQLTTEQLEAEFKDLVDDWDWQVQKINSQDFILIFLSKESWRIVIRGRCLTLPSSKFQATVAASSGDPAAVEQLVEVKVLLYGVPPPYCLAEHLLLGTRELGRPLL